MMKKSLQNSNLCWIISLQSMSVQINSPVTYGKCLLQRSIITLYDNSGMQVLLDKGFSQNEHFTSKYNDGSGSIAHLLVLGSTEFDHGFGGGVRNVHFAKYAVSVVGNDYSAHWVQQHLRDMIKMR